MNFKRIKTINDRKNRIKRSTFEVYGNKGEVYAHIFVKAYKEHELYGPAKYFIADKDKNFLCCNGKELYFGTMYEALNELNEYYKRGYI